jgi:hypothetical protein
MKRLERYLYPQIIYKECSSDINPRKFYDREDFVDTPHVCKFFGCGKHLSIDEQLYGEFCINHQKKENPIFR